MNRVNDKNCPSEKFQGQRGRRNVKCEISQALVMINLFMKFHVHCTLAKQVIVLKVTDGRTGGRMHLMTIGIRQNFSCSRHKKLRRRKKRTLWYVQFTDTKATLIASVSSSHF